MTNERVDLTHPNLPGRSINVTPGEARHHERAGWQQAANATPVSLTKPAADETTEGNEE